MSKLKRRFYKYLWLTRPLTYLVIASVLIIFFILLIPKLGSFFRSLAKGPAAVISAINPSIQKLDSFKDRTNILLLGTGGGDHPGADLTDSIMLVSINILTSDTVLISLPRDIWVESLSAKLNTAYHYGEEKITGGGLTLTKSAVAEITNQPIHYGVMLDFSGFERAIDVVGGIDLNVPRSFVDKQYPIPGQEEAEPKTARYEVLEFFSGDQHMDGSTALKYVRSRHAEGEEGTDYSRAERQQRVILSFKEKVLSSSTLLNFKKTQALKRIVLDSVKTDLPSSTYPDLLKLSLRLDQTNIRTGIIDQGSWSEDIPPLLYSPPTNLYGQWVLLPINNDWQPIYTHIENILYQNQ
jgi:polyisoprenyl-teichoic acid--peptidoglycan teichoic acid transferase